MNDYAYHQASFAGSLPGAGILNTVIRNWQARKSVRRLQTLDDNLLRDIGVSRDEITEALRQPYSTNVALYLDGRISR